MTTTPTKPSDAILKPLGLTLGGGWELGDIQRVLIAMLHRDDEQHAAGRGEPAEPHWPCVDALGNPIENLSDFACPKKDEPTVASGPLYSPSMGRTYPAPRPEDEDDDEWSGAPLAYQIATPDERRPMVRLAALGRMGTTAAKVDSATPSPEPAPGSRLPECPHGVGLCTATCPSKMAAPVTEPPSPVAGEPSDSSDRENFFAEAQTSDGAPVAWEPVHLDAIAAAMNQRDEALAQVEILKGELKPANSECHDCGAACEPVKANRVVELFGLTQAYVAPATQCVSCKVMWMGHEAEDAEMEGRHKLMCQKIRNLEDALTAANARAEALEKQLASERAAHEVTKRASQEFVFQSQCTCRGMALGTYCATWCGIFGLLKCAEEVGAMHRNCNSTNVVAHVDKIRDGRGSPVCAAHLPGLLKQGHVLRRLQAEADITAASPSEPAPEYCTVCKGPRDTHEGQGQNHEFEPAPIADPAQPATPVPAGTNVEVVRPIVVGSLWSAGAYRVRVTGLDMGYVHYRVEADTMTGQGTHSRVSFVKVHTWVSDPPLAPTASDFQGKSTELVEAKQALASANARAEELAATLAEVVADRDKRLADSAARHSEATSKLVAHAAELAGRVEQLEAVADGSSKLLSPGLRPALRTMGLPAQYQTGSKPNG